MIGTEPVAHSAGRLVIVEDEAILALDLQRHLTRAGFDVRGVAADSEAALAMVEAERPDLVLMDIRIQGPRDGIETAAALRARFDVPVVYLTAHSDPKTIERAQLTEPMGYLLKPFKKPDLQNVVTIALARSSSERKLRRREEALRVTLSCIGEAILTTDPEGRVTYLNLAAEQLVGRLSPEAMNQPLGEVLALRAGDGGPMGEEPVFSAQTHGRVQFESTLAGPSGARSLAGTAAELRHGTTSFGVVLALRDLTDLLLARKQLEFAERLSSLGTLAAGVAHEVNNPLSAVINNLEYALTGVLSAPTRQALAEAADGAHRVARIVGDLHSLARPQTEPLRLIEPGEVIGSALAFTRGQWRGVAGVVLQLQAAPPVMAAPARLAQVFVNLIINAVHAMQATGGPHLLTLTSSTNGRGEAVLTVSDTGAGIPEALRERIFEPFFTTKPTGQGSGLGLAVSRAIVESQGGVLGVDRGPGGVGTSFWVVLPGAKAALPQRPPLRAWWVGERCAQSEVLLAQAQGVVLTGREQGPEMLLAHHAPEVVLLTAASTVMMLPELEARVLRIGAAPPPAGVMCLREPFDVGALRAFIRREWPGPKA